MTTVIYHKSDFDGLFCEQIARKALGEDVQYIGYEYGDPVPNVHDFDQLLMLDISIAELMDHPLLVWIDHHKTAIEKYGPRTGYQIDGVAACRLAWQWFFCKDEGNEPARHDYDVFIVDEPLAVRLAGLYDVWDKRDPRAELFQHGLRSVDLTNCWLSLLEYEDEGENCVHKLLQRAEAIEYYVKSQNAEIIHNVGFDLDFEGRKFLALNTARYNSLNFEAGLKPEHDGCLGFKWVGDKWSVSMYGVPGKPDIDFSAIAQKWGGGGHKQACGFTAKSLPWLEIE